MGSKLKVFKSLRLSGYKILRLLGSGPQGSNAMKLEDMRL